MLCDVAVNSWRFKYRLEDLKIKVEQRTEHKYYDYKKTAQRAQKHKRFFVIFQIS
jgi:hypothetical protein